MASFILTEYNIWGEKTSNYSVINTVLMINKQKLQE